MICAHRPLVARHLFGTQHTNVEYDVSVMGSGLTANGAIGGWPLVVGMDKMRRPGAGGRQYSETVGVIVGGTRERRGRNGGRVGSNTPRTWIPRRHEKYYLLELLHWHLSSWTLNSGKTSLLGRISSIGDACLLIPVRCYNTSENQDLPWSRVANEARKGN